MVDHGSDSDFDDDEFGHDVTPVASHSVCSSHSNEEIS